MTSQSPLLAILWQNTPIQTLNLMWKETWDHQRTLTKTLKAELKNLDLEPIPETLAKDRLDPTVYTAFCTPYNLGSRSLMMLEF